MLKRGWGTKAILGERAELFGRFLKRWRGQVSGCHRAGLVWHGPTLSCLQALQIDRRHNLRVVTFPPHMTHDAADRRGVGSIGQGFSPRLVARQQAARQTWGPVQATRHSMRDPILRNRCCSTGNNNGAGRGGVPGLRALSLRFNTCAPEQVHPREREGPGDGGTQAPPVANPRVADSDTCRVDQHL